MFANAQYDLGWLRTLGVEVKGRINDICIADTLLDEERPDGYSLGALSRRWLGKGKDEKLLLEAALNWGFDHTNYKANLWKLPANLVGPYGEADPVQTLAIWQKQKPVLRAEDLWTVYELERQLIPILFEMYWRGIPVDTAYAEELNGRWLARETELLRGLGGIDIWSTAHLARLCDKEGIRYPRTKPTKNFPRGQPSITKALMEGTTNAKLKAVQEVRAINRSREVYLEQNLITNVYKGRIHPQYIQMASDDGGTRTMRLACRNPNAQQFPKRSTLFDAKALRKALVPEPGCQWTKFDYWSQEPVIQLHYALIQNLPGAEAVKAQFLKGIKLAQYVEQASGGRLSYDMAKQVILARSYNQQAPGMAETTGMPLPDCETILAGFDQLVPYVSILNKALTNKARDRGWIRLLAGHKSHFNLWEVPRWERPNIPGENWMPLPLELAEERWPDLPLIRAGTYKSFNRLCQGGAAGQTKTALVEINRSVGLPQMTVHDEISKSTQSEKEAKLMNEIMVHCIPLVAPVRADLSVGPTWS